ncbi:hypothetical protein GZH47_33035 (plasmid) [Paenibacillus rhizovicinus]|uniref:Uncharacterized protein n=1 Tax=Paenibacillus rhizovicinus TaxID=2704463 RepID=A0A6C0PAW2_9BACL|nr:hypothetical protein [Paenibacillus rhizovicinus]QHW35720.1 hypothetical protein GZH47_33035 [Paenibacillus rhizovicinus]
MTNAIKMTCAIFVIIFLAPTVIPAILGIVAALVPALLCVLAVWLVYRMFFKKRVVSKPQVLPVIIREVQRMMKK